jgi:drug/metabolite transporter (DMT)-like permease
MSTSVMWGFILAGAGAVVAGVLGLALPARERLAAAFPLVIGAGVGVVALAIGTYNSTSPEDAETAFLIASALGFATVILSSALIWSRHRSKRSPPVSTDDTAP